MNIPSKISIVPFLIYNLVDLIPFVLIVSGWRKGGKALSVDCILDFF